MARASDFGRRLANVIRDLAADNDTKLAKAIGIGRKRVKDLRLNRDSATIGLRELDRLDAHLVLSRGRGLLDVVPSKRPLFHVLAQRNSVVFLLGMRRLKDAQHVRVVDLEAAMSLQETLTQARLVAGIAPQAFGTRTALVDGRPPAWPVHTAASSSSAALLCFGSPKSNPFTAAMFKRLVGSGKESPFWLGFPERPNRPSPFMRHERRWRHRGLHLAGESKPFLGEASRSFGLVVAHRNTSGVLCIACAGTTGQATLASVQILGDITEDVPADPRLALFVVIAATHALPRDSEITGRSIVTEKKLPLE